MVCVLALCSLVILVVVSVCHSLFVSLLSKTGRISNKAVSVFVPLKWVLIPPVTVINTVGHNKCVFTCYVIFMHSLHNCTPNCVVPTQFNVTIGKQPGAMAPCLCTKQKRYFYRFPLSFQCVATLCRPYIQKCWDYCTCAMRKKPRYTWCTSVVLSYCRFVELSYCRVIVLSNYRIVVLSYCRGRQYDNTTDRDDGPFGPPYKYLN